MTLKCKRGRGQRRSRRLKHRVYTQAEYKALERLGMTQRPTPRDFVMLEVFNNLVQQFHLVKGYEHK